MASNTLGSLIIELRAKTDAFERGMKSARDLSFTTSSDIVGSLERIGKSLLNLRFNNLQQVGRSLSMVGGVAAATGAALTASIIAVAVKSANEIDAMGKSAEKAGMGIKVFSEYAYAAKRADIPIEDFTNSMAKLNKTALAAAQGNAEAQRALKLATGSSRDSVGPLRSTDQILSDIIKRYEGLTDKTLKSALAQQVFGRAGAVLIPFLNQGTKGIEALRRESEALGVAIGPEILAEAQQFHDGLEKIEAGGRGMALQFTAGVLPALNQLVSAFTNVEGHTSPMRSLGETIGEWFKYAAKAAATLTFTVQEMWTALSSSAKQAAEAPWWRKMIPGAILFDAFKVNPKTEDEITSRFERYKQLMADLNKPPSAPGVSKEKTGVGTSGLNPEANNFATQEIQKLRERAQANLALAAAQLIGEQSVRATTAATQADAVILQIATNASKQHKTAIEAEIAAAQKKYGATVLTLVAIEQEAARQQQFNKALSDQTDEANLSADAHNRLAQAILQGGSAITEASIANQIDALVNKADLKLTQDQIAALNQLKDAKRADADAAISEAINRETVSLTNAAHATQLLIVAQREGNDAEIEARAQIEAENFAIQNNISLTDKRIAKIKEQIAENMRAGQAQSTGASLTSQYDPTADRKRRIEEINAAEAAGTISAVVASRARSDAYLREQEALDQLAIRTGKASAGFLVGVNEMVRAGKDMASQMRDAFANVWGGFENGFRNAARNVLMGTRTIGQGFRDLGVSILGAMIESFAGIVAKWIETHLILAAIHLVFKTQQTATDAAATAAQVGVRQAANLAMAISDAGLAAAGAFAYYSAIAPEAAPALAAAQYAEGLGIASLAAFDFGGIMPKTGVALVHQDEGVLTGPTTRMLTNVNKMVNSMDSNHLAAAAYAGGSAHPSLPPITIHVNGAQDPDLVAQKVSDAVMARVKRNFRTAGVSR